MPRMFLSTWSNARYSFDGTEDVIWRGWHSKWLFAMLGISSGVAMVNDLEAVKVTVY
jgi:hypothetical protein